MARRGDELNLSLTGSQISAISARSTSSSRPKSAQNKRASSMLDVRQNKATNGGDVPSDARQQIRNGSVKAETPPASQRSAASLPAPHSGKKAVNGAIPKGTSREEDFLALFESSTQPKIKRPSSGANANTEKKKPSANAVKVLWSEPKPKLKSKKPAWASKPSSEVSTARSEEPHNIFRPASVRSTEDEMDNNDEAMDNFGNSLSQSISKLQNLQNQLSGVNKQKSNSSENNLALNSYRSTSSAATLTPRGAAYSNPRASAIDDFIQDIMDRTPRNEEEEEDFMAGLLPSASGEKRPGDGGDTQEISNSSLANNISRPGQKQKAKASLSSMKNSYQNIKHKTPVNQVKSSSNGGNGLQDDIAAGPSSARKGDQQNTSKSSTNTTQLKKTPSNAQTTKLASQNTVEDYIKTLNSAATKIQRWFRRHSTRRAAAAAAMKRFLSQKKQEHQEKMQKELTMSMTAAEMEEKKAEERKKTREEKAKEARQQAIKDLQKKREERKNEVKKIADEEIQFLQASGKITKSPSMGSLGSKKKRPASRVSSKDTTSPRSGQGNSTPAPLSARELEDLFTSHTTAQQPLSKSSQDEDAASGAVGGTDKATEANTRTTLEDLYSTLKKLEEEENFLSARSEKKPSWLDELEKAQEGELGSNLTAENLEKLNSRKDGLSKSGLLTDDKLKSIINFLDEVQVTDRLSEIDTEISRMNEDLEKPALLMPSAEEVSHLENAQATASEVTNTVLSQRLELDEKKRTVSMLQKALNQQRELTVRHARETEKEMKKRLDVQKEEYEEAIKRHLSFIDQLIDDKKNLGEKCEKLVTEMKTVDKKYQDKMKSLEESHTIEMTKLKEVHSAAEKLRREKWIEDKTKKIKEMTVKGLEPEIQRLIAKHKADVKKIKQIHEAELLEADERAAQKYVKMTEELRDQLATEKEAAVARERENSKQRYEKQLQQEEEAYQQQRRRLYQEVQEEKDRVASSSSRQRAELEKLRCQLEENHRIALESMREEFDKTREEQEKRHKAEIKDLREKLKIEKESWEENYMKRHETWLVQKEREIRDKVKKERDKEIELVIERLEEDASTTREESERSTEQKIRRLREKFENETRELEQSERKAVQKYNEIKAKMTEVEGENERLKVIIKQKEQEIFDNKKLLEKMNSERRNVSDIIRQEFADRIVATDEENKRIKHEISELRARHRHDLDKAHNDMEELRRTKDEEMEEVHKRVKQAIVKKEEVVAQLKQQYQAANKRADHLEGLLEQQRKQLLSKK